MTKILKAILTKAIISAQLTAIDLKSRLKQTLACNKGDVLGQHGLAIIISLVVAAIALPILIDWFKDDVGVQLATKTDEFFAMK